MSLLSAYSRLETAVAWAATSIPWVVSRSCTRPAKAVTEAASLLASSTREAYIDSRSSSIFSTTVFNLSASIVEATYIKAAMGLDFPILANSINAVGGAICPRAFNLGIII